jgi:hypothetical protein
MFLRPAVACSVANLSDSPPDAVYQGLRHALTPTGLCAAAQITAARAAWSFASHGGQDVIARAEADEKGEGYEPYAEGKVGRNLGECRNISRIIVRGHALVGLVLSMGKMAEPNVMIKKDETWMKKE